MYRNMAQRSDDEDFDEDEFEEDEEYDGGTGCTHRVTNFSDGSSITHFGGPVGDVKTNKFGEEC